MKLEEMINKVICGEAIKTMKSIPDKAIDMILCDLPYGTTVCSWDTIIPFEPLWEAYKRIIKDNGAIVLTARNPFTAKLVISNLKGYKHKWVWNKKLSGSFANAPYMPLQVDEDILVFTANGEKVNYYPIMRKGIMRVKGKGITKLKTMSKFIRPDFFKINDDYYPSNILEIGNTNKQGVVHPTQKPVALFEYLIKTYTNENDLVLDNCCGSGTTGRACKNLNRRFIEIELDPTYARIAEDRLKQGVLNF